MAADLDDPKAFVTMKDQDRDALLAWINNVISPRKTVLRQSSYYLKHLFERDTKIYVANGEFKGAMRECGYAPINEDEQNWLFKINVQRAR